MNFICPICGTNSLPDVLCPVTLGYDTEFDLVECQNCRTTMLQPLPSVEQLAGFYAAEYYGSDWYRQRGLGMAFSRTHLRREPPGKFLDVGCGVGYFIDGVRQKCDWSVCGVEFSQAAVEYARQHLQLDVRHGELSQVNFPSENFDYIRICNVLEHVLDLLDMMRECRRIITPDGRLHLSVPSGIADRAGLIRFYREQGKPALSKDGHLYFFPKQALLRIFEETGFRIVNSGTISLRRGLTNLGLFPRKRRWNSPYIWKDRKNEFSKDEINLPPEKKRPFIYYRYRYLRQYARMLPGMFEPGLEFKILLRPV